MSSSMETDLRAIYNEKKTKIIPANIKKDVTIFGVTGTYDGAILPYGRMLDNLDNINNTQISLRQDLSAITFVGDISGYSTTSGESYPITECKIDSHSSMAVLANQGDVATAIGLTANKIKLGETILGVTGTYEGTAGGVKSFSTITEMQQDSSAQEGDIAIVLNLESINVTPTMEFDKCTFPSSVVLSEAFTNDFNTYFTSAESGKSFDGTVRLTPTSFSFSSTGTTSISVTYTSNDGITYTRTDGGDETITIHTKIKGSYPSVWVDEIGEFMTIKNNEFSGPYMFDGNEYVLIDVTTE